MIDEPKEPRISVWRELRPGEILRDATGRGFRIRRFLAEGGYSHVYEAEREIDPDLAPYIAVKVLNLKHAKNKKTLRRQMSEARGLRKLKHPNVVRVHTIGARAGTGMVFMVMDLLVGRTLRELTRDLGGRMPIPWTLQIMISVCRGLTAIHAIAVHRDLKPENIHARDDGHISLFDLGTSRFLKEDRLTTQGYTIGTLNYMSPEQLAGAEELDGRSDLFTIGTMLYELLSGVNPFAGTEGKRDRQEIGNRIMFWSHTPLNQLRKAGPESELIAKNVPGNLVDIVERLLRKEANNRYASAAIVADLLTAALAKFTLDNKAHPALPISTLGTVPRTPEPEQADEVGASVPTSTNPFISISFPPEEATGEIFRAAQPVPSPAYASTEQIAVYALPPRKATPFEETGPERIYMDPDTLTNTTLTPHATRLQDERSLPTEQMRTRRASRVPPVFPRVPPVFLYMVGVAALIVAGLFVLGSIGVIGHRRAAPSGAAPIAPTAQARSTPAPRPE